MLNFSFDDLTSLSFDKVRFYIPPNLPRAPGKGAFSSFKFILQLRPSGPDSGQFIQLEFYSRYSKSPSHSPLSAQKNKNKNKTKKKHIAILSEELWHNPYIKQI